MKEVREERFTKREDVGFNPPPLPDNPPPARSPEAPRAERSNVRTERPAAPERPATAYVVVIPATRRKTRQSFDIFADQYDALKKLQLAEADQSAHSHGRKMGDMVQEALDAFIQAKAKALGTISIQRAHE